MIGETYFALDDYDKALKYLLEAESIDSLVRENVKQCEKNLFQNSEQKDSQIQEVTHQIPRRQIKPIKCNYKILEKDTKRKLIIGKVNSEHKLDFWWKNKEKVGSKSARFLSSLKSQLTFSPQFRKLLHY